MPSSNLELLRVFRDGKTKLAKVEVNCKLCGQTWTMWRSHYYRGDTPCDCKHWRKHYPRLYSIYTNMKTRCYNPNSPQYKNYGGRGITVCDEWLDSFEKFKDWALSANYNDNLTIERINVNGNYEPTNCTWILSVEQAKNKQVTIHIEGECLRSWCVKRGLNYKLVHQYKQRHPELSLTEVIDYYLSKHKELDTDVTYLR